MNPMNSNDSDEIAMNPNPNDSDEVAEPQNIKNTMLLLYLVLLCLLCLRCRTDTREHAGNCDMMRGETHNMSSPFNTLHNNATLLCTITQQLADRQLTRTVRTAMQT